MVGESHGAHHTPRLGLREDESSGLYDFVGPIETGCVYFIACPQENAVKIGYTKYDEPHHRLQHLRATHIFCLYLIGWLPMGGRQLERNVHDHFREHRMYGEWFDLSNKWVQIEISRILATDGVFEDDEFNCE